MLCLLPLPALVIETLHYLQCKGSGLRIGMGLAQHPHTHFIQARIAQRNGRIAVKEQTVNLFSLFQAGQSAVLPENRRHIGNRAQQALMTASEALWHSSRRSSRIFQNSSISPSLEQATSTRLIVTTP